MAKRKHAAEGVGDKESDKRVKQQVSEPGKDNKPSNDNPPKASLLGVPGEIKNRIYDLVLVNDEEMVEVDKHPAEPGLLRSCRQIREEARDIFFIGNRFMINIKDGAATTVPQTKHWFWMHLDTRKVDFFGRPVWSEVLVNLETFLLHVHVGNNAPCKEWRPPKADDAELLKTYRACYHVIHLVYKLRSLSWYRVNYLLQRAGK